MKVYFSYKPITTSFGGGNQFVSNLTNYLQNKGWEIVYGLNHDNIDVIVIIDPRKKKKRNLTYPKYINIKENIHKLKYYIGLMNVILKD